MMKLERSTIPKATGCCRPGGGEWACLISREKQVRWDQADAAARRHPCSVATFWKAGQPNVATKQNRA